MSAKIAFGVVAGVVVIAFLTQRSRPGAHVGVVGATVDKGYYGALGRCFRSADDTEVAASECTDRSVPLTAALDPEVPGAGIASAFGSFASAVKGWFT
jgi:hypothetical protein